jgi:predicted flap endonuclease-1-like 5' DNA nuclease
MTSEILATYWPLIVGGLILLIALIALFTRRRQHVELSSSEPVIAPTLQRVAPVVTVGSAAPSATANHVGAADDLLRIKGLGPKVAARLNEAGIVRFDQLAALDTNAQATLDVQLGAFAGRMARDRWVEQAALLADDDIAAFEAQFGKLG